MNISNSEYSFSPGAMSIIQMGEEQIGHPSTAINELVKNGYDADADKSIIYINYTSENPKKNFILIYDNGLGMNESILFGKWLQPSMSTKRNQEKKDRISTIYKRKFLGFKGIGRLAAMTLGQYLTIITKTNEEEEYNWLNIDRNKFKTEELLSEIKFPGGKVTNYVDLFKSEKLLQEGKVDNVELKKILLSSIDLDSSSNKILDNKYNFFSQKEGTLIVIQNLDDSIHTIFEEQYTNNFDGNKFKNTSLYKSLADLITPLKLNTKVQEDLVEEEIIDTPVRVDNGESLFSIFYGDSFLKEQEGNYTLYEIESEPILDIYDYRIYGKVSEKYDVDLKYHCKRLPDLEEINKKFTLKKGFLLSDEKYNIRIKNEDVDLKYKGIELGNFFFDIRIYDLDGDVKNRRSKQLGDIGKKAANAILKKHLGLKVSKNGFGVKPYGLGGQDWLELGGKRVQQHEISIGPNQIIGNVILFSPDNDSLKEKTNREGFLENKAFTVFKKILLGVLDHIGRERQKFRLKHNIGRKVQLGSNRPDTNEFLTYVKSQTNNPEFIKYVESFARQTDSALDNMEGALSFSQRLASLGTGLELVYHELSQPITTLGLVKNLTKIHIKKIKDDVLKDKMMNNNENFNAAITLLDELKNSLKPAIGKSMPKNFRPSHTFFKVCNLFREELNKGRLEIHIDKEEMEKFVVKSYEYVFWVSFLNIVNNAVYWLQHIPTSERFIKVDKQLHNDGIIISNNGPLIHEEELEVIFEYGVSNKKQVEPTGLGLTFTKNMLNTIGWEIYAKNLSYGPAFIIQKKIKI